MTPGDFAAKWRQAKGSERSSAQSHFLDICALLDEPGPIDADPTGTWYAFEKGAEKLDGRDGYADVWKRGLFAWEYKGKHKDLKKAYRQLVDYKDALENPPLLVVSDIDRIEVRTNFTGLSPKLYTVTLDDLASADPSEALRVLRSVFTEPEALRPHITPAQLTEEAAKRFAELAGNLQARGDDPQEIAHFLDKLLFCLYAEDTGLLPKGLLSRLADGTRSKPAAFAAALSELFGKMADRGGMFGAEVIQWFNGGLFDSADVLVLTSPEIGTLQEISRLDWSKIEPAIFGTLFERGLDPSQRAQLGAHYTSRDDIWKLVEPVIIRPLRREFEAIQATVTTLVAKRDASGKKGPDPDARHLFEAYLERLRKVRVLDPACGSGNFLYIALQALKDLELEAIQWGSLVLRLPQEFPRVGPEAVLGIEINAYAAELARVTIWIGEIQWMLNHGFHYRHDPVLQPLDSIATSPNPDGRSNREVVRPWVNGLDLSRRSRGMWIIDFGVDQTERQAALYESPFEYVRTEVRPTRVGNNRTAYADRWWLHVEPRSGMRAALRGLSRYIATPRVSKHRLFVWLGSDTLLDSACIAIARDDDYTFGVLHSRVHELWARGTGTQVREVESGFRYTPTTTFETFPFPHPTEEQRDQIAEAAGDLDRLRQGWLNPPNLPTDELELRTLTNLYNQRPTWLSDAHHGLDIAVLAAYGWPEDLDDSSVLERLLDLNVERETA